jgi:ATP-dependent RNA helicase RhlE
VAALRGGVDVVVATPGRLVDLINQKQIDLRSVSTLVLDEADHMLDLGFIHDVKTVIRCIPEKRQTLLFSATMPKEIAALADSILREPVKVAVAPVSSPVESVGQSVYHVEKANKGRLLVDLLQNGGIETGLVFSRTKHGADKISKMLNSAGIKAGAIHGNKSQSARNEALGSFKKGKLRVLVATDIAARGIDVQALPHVVNYDLPEVPETYVHRIGRTGRAGLKGTAISFCDPAENPLLRDIERLVSFRIPVVKNHPLASAPVPEVIPAVSLAPQRRQAQGKPSGQRRPQRQGGGQGSRPGSHQGGGSFHGKRRSGGHQGFSRAAS